MTSEKPTPGPDTAIRKYPTLLRRYANLLQVMHRLSSTVHLEDIYNQIVDGTVSLLECKASLLMTVDPANKEIQIVSATHLDPASYQNRSIPPETSLAGKVIKSGAPVLIATKGEELKRTITTEEFKTLIDEL